MCDQHVRVEPKVEPFEDIFLCIVFPSIHPLYLGFRILTRIYNPYPGYPEAQNPSVGLFPELST